MTIENVETVPCIQCQKPSGVPQINPWTIPAGARASLIVTCGACMHSMLSAHEQQSVKWTPRGTEGLRSETSEAPPNDEQLAHALVLRRGGAYAATAVLDGRVLLQQFGFATAGDAFAECVQAVKAATEQSDSGVR